MRISLGLGPWGALGSAAGGLAEGMATGMALNQRNRALDEAEKRDRLHAALQLIQAGGKAEDPQMVAAINAMLGQVAPNMPQLPVIDPAARIQQEADKTLLTARAIAQRSGIPEGSPEFKHIYNSVAGIKDMPEYTMMQGPDGQMYPVKKGSELGAVTNLMRTQAYLQKLAQHGGGGGGGARGLTLWRGPNGEPIWAPKGPPPVPGAVPTTPGAFERPEEVPQPIPFEERKAVAKVIEKRNAGKPLTAEEQATIAPYNLGTVPGMGGSVQPFATHLPPTYTKPPKKRKRSVDLPEPTVIYQQQAEVPPPPEGFVED